MDKNEKIVDQKELLLELAKSGALSHAIIIECDSVCEAYDFFVDVIKTRLCTGENKPCGKCPNCVKMASNSHPDVTVIEAVGKNKTIKIDEIRKIREDAYIISNEGSDKFYIIEDADYMTVQAQNALIKILEEPPKNVVFVLICSSCGNLLSTIRSRAHVFKIKSVLKSEQDNILLASEEIVRESLSGRSDRVLECISKFGSDRKEFKILLENIIENLIKRLKDGDIDENLADNLILKIDKLRDLSFLIDKNVNMNLFVSVVCSCL